MPWGEGGELNKLNAFKWINYLFIVTGGSRE
jgi:hypothetical protein